MVLTDQRILSPLCIPISSPRRERFFPSLQDLETRSKKPVFQLSSKTSLRVDSRSRYIVFVASQFLKTPRMIPILSSSS